MINNYNFFAFWKLFLIWLVYNFSCLFRFSDKNCWVPNCLKSNNLIKRFWHSVDVFIGHQNGLKFIITGDKLDTTKPTATLLISNHNGVIDYLILSHYISVIKGSTPYFFSWASSWKLPSVRTVCRSFEISENWDVSRLDSAKMINAYDWTILFPEVNSWSTSNASKHTRFCDKYCLPQLKNLLYPRFPSFINASYTYKYIQSEAKLVDITIRYYWYNKETDKFEPKTPNFMEFFFGDASSYVIRIHITRKNLDKLSTNKRKLEKWLEREWVLKDAFIQSLDQNLSLLEK